MKCPECTFDENGRCVECGSFKPVSNDWIEVVCPFCPPINEEQIASGAFHSGDNFKENVPFKPQIMARFIFEVGAFNYVVVQCPKCLQCQAVFNGSPAGSGFSIGDPPSFSADIDIDKLRAKYEKYEAFVIYDPRLRREFAAFCAQGIFNPRLRGLGAVQKRIQSGTFQLTPNRSGGVSGSYMGTGDDRSPMIAAVDFLKDREASAQEIPVSPFDRTWKGFGRRVWLEFKAFRKKRLAKDKEPV